jgi:hypothetical protein
MKDFVQQFVDLGFKIDGLSTLIKDNAKIYLTSNKAVIEFCEQEKEYYKGTEFRISDSMSPRKLISLLKEKKNIKTTVLPF